MRLDAITTTQALASLQAMIKQLQQQKHAPSPAPTSETDAGASLATPAQQPPLGSEQLTASLRQLLQVQSCCVRDLTGYPSNS